MEDHNFEVGDHVLSALSPSHDEKYGDDTYSHFSDEFVKVDPAVTLIRHAPKSGNVFDIPQRGNSVGSLYVTFTLPNVVVTSSQYRVAWSRKVGIAALENVSLRIGDKNFKIPREALDMLRLTTQPKQDIHNRMIGNVPKLTEFTDNLPQYKVSVEIPINPSHYTQSNLQRAAFDDTVSLKVDTVPSLKSLLRIQQQEKGEWFDLSVSSGHATGDIQYEVDKLIQDGTVKAGDWSLQDLQLVTMHHILTNAQVTQLRKYRSHMIRHYSVHKETVEAGEKNKHIPVHLDDASVSHVVILVTNRESSELGNLLNYTTDVSVNTESPVENAGIQLSDKETLIEGPVDLFSQVQVAEYAKVTPPETDPVLLHAMGVQPLGTETPTGAYNVKDKFTVKLDMKDGEGKYDVHIISVIEDVLKTKNGKIVE